MNSTSPRSRFDRIAARSPARSRAGPEVAREPGLVGFLGSFKGDFNVDAVAFLLEEICFAQTLGRAPGSWVVETLWPSLIPDQPDLNLVCAGEEVRAPTAVDRNPASADYLLQYNRKAMWRPIDWAVDRQGDPPAYEITLEGVPLLQVYRLQ